MTDAAKGLFDLNPTEEQLMTRDVMRRFVAEKMTPVARDADEDSILPEGLLAEVMELGLNFMPVPEALGGVGAGRSAVSNILTMEDFAQGDMSMAIAALAPLSVINCVLDHGTEAQQADVCSLLAGTESVAAALALREPGVLFAPAKLATRATRLAEGGFEISGRKCMVLFGAEAQRIVVFAELDGAVQGFIISGDQAGLSFEREDYMGLRALPLFTMNLDKVCVPAEAKMRDDFDLAHFLARSRIAAAALATGTCQAVLDYVVPYVNEREAFGEPISNRQAVAFMVADIAIELEGMRLMTSRAAAQAEQGLDCSKQAMLSHRNAIKYGMKIGTDGVQLLGGHGFTRSHPVELWYRNLRAVPLLEGLLLA